MSDRITAPWEEHEVAALNAFQRSGVMHPFTCQMPHRLHQTLIAERDGWHCPDEDCGYRQDWAWAFMAVPSFPAAVQKPGVAEYLAVMEAARSFGSPMAAENKRLASLLRETENQLGEERRRTADLTQQLTAALLRIQALQVHEAIVRIPAQPPDADGLCGEYLYEKPIRDVPTGGVL